MSKLATMNIYWIYSFVTVTNKPLEDKGLRGYDFDAFFKIACE